MIDTNVAIGRWPFRDLPLEGAAQTVEKLRALGITEAWTAHLNACWHKDLFAVNARLAEECRREGAGLLQPFGTVNPKLPDWQEDLRRCQEAHGMRGLRLFPGYHGYGLDDADFRRLLEQAARRGLLVQIALKLEDERTQHPLVKVPAADPAPLAGVAGRVPGLRLQLLNVQPAIADAVLLPLARAEKVLFDIAMVEGLGGVARFAQRTGAARLALGSHAPLFYPEAAVLKLRESEFSPEELEQIQSGNARELLPSRAR
jgi:hypothetical protein